VNQPNGRGTIKVWIGGTVSLAGLISLLVSGYRDIKDDLHQSRLDHQRIESRDADQGERIARLESLTQAMREQIERNTRRIDALEHDSYGFKEREHRR